MATGAWSVDPAGVVETTTPLAGSDRQRLVVSATCSFLFTGTTNANGASFTPPPSVVNLGPGARLLTVGGSCLLVDGDEASDAFDNTVVVASGATWRTALS